MPRVMVSVDNAAVNTPSLRDAKGHCSSDYATYMIDERSHKKRILGTILDEKQQFVPEEFTSATTTQKPQK